MSNSNQEEKPLSLKEITAALRAEFEAERKQGSAVKGETQETHNKVHSVRSFEKWCPDCGVKNPNYTRPVRKCSRCEQPATSEAKVCWNCGSKHLENDETEEDEEEDEEED